MDAIYCFYSTDTVFLYLNTLLVLFTHDVTDGRLMKRQE